MFDSLPSNLELAQKILLHPRPFSIPAKYLRALVELDQCFDSSICSCICFEYKFGLEDSVDLILNLRGDQGDMARTGKVIDWPHWSKLGKYSPFEIIREIEQNRTWNRLIQHVWLEFDWMKDGPVACPGIFLHFDGCKNGIYKNESEVNLEYLLTLLTGQSSNAVLVWCEHIRGLLDLDIDEFGLFAVGWLPSRTEQTLRLCLSTFSFYSVKKLLSKIGIDSAVIDGFESEADELFFALALDLGDTYENRFGLEVYPKEKNKISELALSLGAYLKRPEALHFLNEWQTEGWAPDCYISREINHFKISVKNNILSEVKAYLFGRYQSPSVRIRNTVPMNREF